MSMIFPRQIQPGRILTFTRRSQMLSLPRVTGLLLLGMGLIACAEQIEETDCVLRTYGPGQVTFHRGQGIRDVGFNALGEGEGETRIVGFFIGVPPGEPVSTPAPDPGC
jgi:hypothetical protein